jgi:hypothetical protein
MRLTKSHKLHGLYKINIYFRGKSSCKVENIKTYMLMQLNYRHLHQAKWARVKKTRNCKLVSVDIYAHGAWLTLINVQKVLRFFGIIFYLYFVILQDSIVSKIRRWFLYFKNWYQVISSIYWKRLFRTKLTLKPL